MEQERTLKWGTGGHWCQWSFSEVPGAHTPREEEEYEEGLDFHKIKKMKKMPRICDIHETPLRTPVLMDKASWDTERRALVPSRKKKVRGSFKLRTPPQKLTYGEPATSKEVDVRSLFHVRSLFLIQ